MAYYDNLPDNRQDEIRNLLLVNVRNEHDRAYQANMEKAKSRRQKALCAGRYEGAWWRLMDAWMEGKVSNLHVLDCLKHNLVIGDTLGVIFRSANQSKTRTR